MRGAAHKLLLCRPAIIKHDTRTLFRLPEARCHYTGGACHLDQNMSHPTIDFQADANDNSPLYLQLARKLVQDVRDGR